MFSTLRERNFEFEFRSHAAAILQVDFPEAERELCDVLTGLTIPVEEIIMSGGGIGKGTQRLRKSLMQRGWVKTTFAIVKSIDDGTQKKTAESISHEVDHVRRFQAERIALEIEWNNKDPFFDRDLENFKRLHAESAISLGVIVTRGSSLQSALRDIVRKFGEKYQIARYEDLDRFGVRPTVRQRAEVDRRIKRKKNPLEFRDAWAEHFVSDKFGTATTHWSKLIDRLHRGVGNPCPLVCIGLPTDVVTFDEALGVLQEIAADDDEDN
jgi:restriction endonuclease BglII